jgi:diaminopimelate decarboxylase
VQELLPLTARLGGGRLSIGGVDAEALAAEHGTPVVVYCEETLRAQARAYAVAAPGALVVYGTKAFANVAVLRILAEEGVGADVSTLGELAFARAAGIAGDRIVFHGNNKSDEELRAAAEAGATVVLDAPDEAERAAAQGVRRVLVRLTPGVDAHTHTSIRTAHDESKFGLPPEKALQVIADARGRGLDVLGVHFHVGSQLARIDESVTAVERLLAFCARAEEELGWRARVLDIGGGLGIRYTREDAVPSIEEFVGPLVQALPDDVQVILEPGRSLVGRAGVTLYRVGVVKEAGGVTYVAIDGGMSDNPRPQLYGARYEALLANRADELADGVFRIAGKHCESGDVLIQAAELPHPHRGDLLAVPATGAYTLALGSTYNGVPRPPAVLVRDGAQRTLRKREPVADLLRYEADTLAP